ncbi:MAG: hypothetical protein ACE5EM_02130 [Sphingomonadales bacterium]
MTRPRTYLSRMTAFLVIIVVVILALLPVATLERSFMANPALNGLILGVLFIGILYAFRQVFRLNPELDWIENFQREEAAVSISTDPRLLAPMAKMLSEKQGSFSLSTLAMRTLLDGIAARLDEAREISRYLVGLLIFLGLLGTFWGLLVTIGSVGDTIKGLSTQSTDLSLMFEDLKRGLGAPLGGMATAFSSSLFGLAGSLIVGFLDLQAGQAQNRFYNDLEDWLSGQTRLGSAGIVAEGEQSVPAYMHALLEQTADSLDKLERTFSRSEESRTAGNTALLSLSEKIAALADHMRAEQDLMARLAEGQKEVSPVLTRIGQTLDQLGQAQEKSALDDASKEHLRNLDVHLARMLAEISQGRTMLVDELRSEIKLLSRTLAAVMGEGR